MSLKRDFRPVREGLFILAIAAGASLVPLFVALVSALLK